MCSKNEVTEPIWKMWRNAKLNTNAPFPSPCQKQTGLGNLPGKRRTHPLTCTSFVCLCMRMSMRVHAFVHVSYCVWACEWIRKIRPGRKHSCVIVVSRSNDYSHDSLEKGGCWDRQCVGCELAWKACFIWPPLETYYVLKLSVWNVNSLKYPVCGGACWRPMWLSTLQI